MAGAISFLRGLYRVARGADLGKITTVVKDGRTYEVKTVSLKDANQQADNNWQKEIDRLNALMVGRAKQKPPYQS